MWIYVHLRQIFSGPTLTYLMQTRILLVRKESQLHILTDPVCLDVLKKEPELLRALS